MSQSAAPQAPSFRQAAFVWLKLGLLGFGGPAGQIALMHRMLVDERKWIGEARFLHALNYCMMLPGPEAQQLATYMGWLLHRIPGGLVAGTLFVLPGFVVLMGLAALYAGFNDVAFVEGLFFGLKPAVLAVVVEAVVRIGRKAARGAASIALAGAAFVAIFLFQAPFPLIVLGAALIGLAARQCFAAPPVPSASATGGGVIDDLLSGDLPDHAKPNLARALKVAVMFLALWLGPVVALTVVLGPQNVYAQMGWFFSKMAVVTFGGAYAVLAYVAQQAVEIHGWLAPGEMLDGLGLAETTPGPLILVLQFVGFLAAYRDAAGLDPMVAGMLGAALTVWVTFVPCFLWIFLGGPYVEALRGNRAIGSALRAVTAAVVGVILNLAVWFGLHVLFGEIAERDVGWLRLLVPDFASLDPAALVLAVAAMVALFRFRLGMVPVLAGCAVAGMTYRLLA